MKIQRYEDWMRPQVIALFDAEYNTGTESFDALFGAFYEHSFQASNGIRLVALEGDQVAGFQSFFHWPMVHNGKAVRAFQSGNSLVHPDFRGKGIFGKLLDYIHQPENEIEIDLLIGFPVEASYNSFMRKQWANPFDLHWYVRPAHPIRALFTNPEQALQRKLQARTALNFVPAKGATHVQQSAAFDEYRFGYQTGDHFRLQYRSDRGEAFAEVKFQLRKSIIKELIIGKFLCSNDTPEFITEAFEAIVKQINQTAHFTMLSIAVNPKITALVKALDVCGFKPIDRKIHFIAKGPLVDTLEQWDDWWIFRADIDTW